MVTGQSRPPASQLFHLAERAAWEAAKERGFYDLSTRGRTLAEEGFVHCSLPHQVRGVAERYYSDLDDLVLLVVDPARLTAEVRYEANAPGGDEYPHVYGPIPVTAVIHAVPVARDAAGHLVLPE